MSLFSLPFAGVGTFMAGLVLWTLWDWHDMQSWEQVPAEIVHAELETHRGDDSTTYKVAARYTYAYNSVDYESDRVSLHGGSDNIGSYQSRKAAELKQYLKSGQPFHCYVNPLAPAEAVLYPELRMEMLGFYLLFALTFGGVGYGLLFFSVRGMRRKSDQIQLEQQHPQEPWCWDEAWAKGEIRSSNKTIMIFSALFALFWNLISSPVWFLLPAEVRGGNWPALLAGIFPLVGIGLVCWAIVNLLRWWKYGESVFQMASVPGVIGGPLVGVVHTNVKLNPEHGFHVRLSCVHRETSGSGKNRRTHKEILWQDERVIQRELLQQDPSKSAIPVEFAIPFDSRPTDEAKTNDRVLWRLEVSADVPGVDYHATFEVPVFRTDQSSADYSPETSLTDKYEVQEDPDVVIRRAGFRVHKTDVFGVRYVFPMLQIGVASIGFAVFTLIWTAAIVMMIKLGAGYVLPTVFLLFDILFILALADSWLWRSQLDVEQGRVTHRAGLFGWGKRKTIPATDVSRFATESRMQSSSQRYYNLKLVTRSGASLTIAKHIPGKRLAETAGKHILHAIQSQ